MTNLLGYLPVFLSFCIYLSEAQPARFCSTLTRDCTTDCRENGTLSIVDCVAECTCLDAQINPLLSYQECITRFNQIQEECQGRTCGLGRYINDFCSTLPGRCCDPNELDFVECADNTTEPLCCDGEWICPNGNSEQFSCAERLISRECCCDPSDDLSCRRGRRQCCPNDGQWTCPNNFLPGAALYTCSDGNLYTRNEMADECCCDPFEEPGRFGNSFCTDGYVCCPDGTWSCGIGDGIFICDGEPTIGSQMNQGERCVCGEEAELCLQVLVCCDGQVFSTPCAAEAACYDPSDDEFCSYQFDFIGTGCVPIGQDDEGDDDNEGGKGRGRQEGGGKGGPQA